MNNKKYGLYESHAHVWAQKDNKTVVCMDCKTTTKIGIWDAPYCKIMFGEIKDGRKELPKNRQLTTD